MFAFLAALMLVSQQAATQDPPAATIYSTVGHSEWCPAGKVELELDTGKFEFTPRASRRVCQKSGPNRPVVQGVLESSRLEAVRKAYRRAETEGLGKCGVGGTAEPALESKAGKQILVLMTGTGTTAPPDDINCWSEAAQALQDILEDTFRSSQPL